MNTNKVKLQINALCEQLKVIDDPALRAVIDTLFNLIELVMAENDKLRKEVQDLRDELHLLKGEQSQPNIRPQPKPGDHSSENNRKPKGRTGNKKNRKKKKKKASIKPDREETCELDKNQLPDDAQFKGYDPITFQDLKITTDNVTFNREVYYSPSLGKTFTAALPAGYWGGYGPTLKALILDLHYNGKMTQMPIQAFLSNHGVTISKSTISRILTQNIDEFHHEKEAVITAGMNSTLYQQMDDTSARVNGVNHYTHILCNPFYTAFFTRPRKDRLTILDILMRGKLTFVFDDMTQQLMIDMGLSKKQLLRLEAENPDHRLESDAMTRLLDKLFPNPKKNKRSRQIILEASAISAYRKHPHAVAILMTDDAPQFKLISELIALCWIHDGRHYKKLKPVISENKDKVDDFLAKYWDFYHSLLDYKSLASPLMAKKLEHEFDELFATKTGYQALDERILKSQLKKDELLLVLKYPELILHNNNSELGARVQARYRDISLHTITEAGTNAKDTFMTLVETAKKLTVNTYDYFLDRITKKYDVPKLSELISIKALEAEFDSS